MRYSLCLALFISLFFVSCENTDTTSVENSGPFPVTIPTVEREVFGYVKEVKSYFSIELRSLFLSNVTVELRYEDQVLDEANTDLDGAFYFPEQVMPSEGTYLYYRAPGCYPGVTKIDDSYVNQSARYILSNKSSLVNGEAISNREEYITLTGELQNPINSSGGIIVITNSSNEILDVRATDMDLSFRVTVVPGEEVFLHYLVKCGSLAPVSLGTFTESTDVGVVYDPTYDLSEDRVYADVYPVDCTGEEVTQGYLLKTVNGQTTYYNEFLGYPCSLLGDPDAYVTYVNPLTQEYGERNINYSSGTELDFNMTICEEDETYLSLTLSNGLQYDFNLYTFANIMPDGRLFIKQVNSLFDIYDSIVFELNAATPGTTTANLRILGPGNKVFQQADNFTASITANDGDFIEGTFSAEIFDEFEQSLGVITSTFKARVH